MKNQSNISTKENARKELNSFMQKLTIMDNHPDNEKLKLYNKELELFLDVNCDGADGFLDSLKKCNKSGAWFNTEYLKRIIHHFQRKWGTQNTTIVY